MARAIAPPAVSGPRVDWGDALAVTLFYGREWELSLLSEWVVEERCRVVSVLGQGGIGKSALATKVMHRVAERFEVVIWRSLRDVPICEALLDDCLQVLAPQALRSVSSSLESRQGLLLECLRSRRVLLVYDNLESFLEEGQDTGHMRPGYEGLARVLRRVAETEHQSCLLLTSREKPGELVPLEGSQAPVRALRLARLDDDACQQLLAKKGVAGSAAEQTRLIKAYAGNPLALNIVAQTIVELFGGEIAPFLEQGEVVFGGVRELLSEQFARLSALEQSVLLWLAVLRELVSLPELLAVLGTPMPRATVLGAVAALRRRSLIELGQHPGSFTLQSVVLEYATAQLIAEVASEIEHGRLSRLVEHGLALAGAREYVRQTQVRLIVAPLLAQVRSAHPERVDLEKHLLALLDRLRAREDSAQGYGPANVLALLGEQRGHLRGLDLSQLSLRGMNLQGVEMQDTTLAGARLQGCVWTSTLGAIWAVATSRSGQYWAAGSRRGEVWVWKEAGQVLHLVWQAHTDIIRTLSFSPDGCRLASGSDDGMIKLWDVESGALLWSGGHTNHVSAVAFAPDGSLLASGGIDATVRLWDSHSSTPLETLPHPDAVSGITWSPDERLLASGGFDGQIRLWKIEQSGSANCVAILAGHSSWVFALAFAPDGSLLASGSWDRTVKLWEVASGGVSQTLVGHTDRVHTVAWSPDGRTVASAGFDQVIWLWDVENGSSRMVLSHGHNGVVFGLAFTPDSRNLLSGSADGTLRVWDVESGQCVQIMQGYGFSLYDVAWSPDGTRLASGGGTQGQEDIGELFVWDVQRGERVHTIAAHPGMVYSMAWSPSGTVLVSGGSDGMLRWWDVEREECVRIRRAHQGTVHRLQVSPDGSRLASCGDDGAITLWNLHSGEHLRTLRRDRPYERLDITGIRGVTEAQKASLRTLGAIEDSPS